MRRAGSPVPQALRSAHVARHAAITRSSRAPIRSPNASRYRVMPYADSAPGFTNRNEYRPGNRVHYAACTFAHAYTSIRSTRAVSGSRSIASSGDRALLTRAKSAPATR